MALTWEQGAVVTALLAATWAAFRVSQAPAARSAAPWAREAFVISALYSVWQLAGTASVTGASGAQSRAHWIEHAQHVAHLPPESDVQQLIVGHSVFAQAANYYYASMHFGALFVFLVWLFVRHRRRYAAIRTTLALTTLVCLLIQLMPVAPPRLMPGFVDTARQYGESVYSLGFGADELSAMPSVHVAWAVFVSYYVVRLGRSRWRWVPALHAPITIFVVIATANHWWLDAAVAVLVLVVCAWLRYGLGRVMIAIRLYARPRIPAPVVASAATSSPDVGAQS